MEAIGHAVLRTQCRPRVQYPFASGIRSTYRVDSPRSPVAAATAAKALAVQREVSAMKTDDQWHKPHLALALVASAYANPAQATALIAEAQAVLDSMPAEPRAWRTSRWVDGVIADARRTIR